MITSVALIARLRVVALCLFATLVPAEAADSLRIGVSGDGIAGTIVARAVWFAIEDTKKSGILTQDTEVISRDDQCKPDIAATNARTFTDMERVNLAISGSACAAANLAASTVYREKNTLQIDAASTHPILTEQVRGKNVPLFRLAERQDRAADIAFIVLKNEIANKNVCLVGEASRKTWLDRFQTLAAGSPKKLAVTDAIPDQSSGSDLCIVYDPYNRDSLGTIGKRDDVYAVLGPDDRFPSPSANIDAIKELSKRLRSAGFSPPFGPAINAYAAVQIWAAAMKEARSSETSKVAEQIRRLKFETIRGLVSFDEAGDVRQPLITIVRYSNPIIQVPNKCNEPTCKDCKCSECCK
ncbi:hypothetical protein BSN85_16305 [Bradyrhizobium brasilense]|uniref:ABC transporter substrate-binding protein n=1 Tax=Bradyrhizobium brasilense TaxID=1419277 RepID=UPI000975EDA9|nr:ABC transporter substrate-binding protein [Bradyrhizobium brasilense]OMI09490.1 hypothetical protein BSN85_16305 [Bradyrhizobium brasilense]